MAKYRIKQKTGTNTTKILHPETEADIVLYDNTDSGLTATNVQAAIDEIVESGVGVTGVKGNAEQNYRTGQVNLTPANIGAVEANTTITANANGAAKIKYDSKGLVTGSGSLVENDIPTLSQSKITNLTTDLASKLNVKPDGTNNLITNNKINTTYIPDTLLGQLVYGGTVTGAGVATLSTNAKSKLVTSSNSITLTNNTTATTGYTANEGIFYIVSSSGSFASLGLEVGDWLISTGSAWKKIDNTDAVASVNGKIGAVVLNTDDINMASDETITLTTAINYFGTELSNVKQSLNDYIPNHSETDEGVASKMLNANNDEGQFSIESYGTSTVGTAHLNMYNGKLHLQHYTSSQDKSTNYNSIDIGSIGQEFRLFKDDGTLVYKFEAVKTGTANVWFNDNDYFTLSKLGSVLNKFATNGATYSGQAATATNFASAKTVALTGDVTGSANGGASGGWSVATTLANSGVTAGTYSAVTVNAKGLVTAGYQFVEVGTVVGAGPSTNLSTLGIFYELIEDDE